MLHAGKTLGLAVVVGDTYLAHASAREQPARRGQPEVKTLQISLREVRPCKVPRVGRYAHPTNSDGLLSIDGWGSEGRSEGVGEDPQGIGYEHQCPVDVRKAINQRASWPRN